MNEQPEIMPIEEPVEPEPAVEPAKAKCSKCNGGGLLYRGTENRPTESGTGMECRVCEKCNGTGEQTA